MKRKGLIIFVFIVVVASFAGVAGISIHAMFKAYGTVGGIIAIVATGGVAYILFSFLYKRYRIYKGAEDDFDDDGPEYKKDKNKDEYWDDKP